MKEKLIGIAMAFLVLFAPLHVNAAQFKTTIASITEDDVVTKDGKEYKLVLRRTHKHKRTVYFYETRPIPFEELLGVGYIDQALITVDGNVITRIDVLHIEM